MSATTRRSVLGLAAVVLLAALTWYLQDSSASPSGDAPGSTGSIGSIAAQDLPVEARQTLALIDAGGPFPYPRNDGIVFENREDLLPDQPRGYYHEYTVPTPGSEDRGARRLVTGGPADGAPGGPTEYYWTDDHYRSFERIRR